MQAPNLRHYSVEEYFALDEAAPEGVRLEYDEGTIYLNGQIYDPEWGWEEARNMAGATPEHNQVSSNVAYLVTSQLRPRGCHVLTSDQRVEVGGGKYVYPDIVASCRPNYNGMHLLNPELIIEVLSPGSAERDLSQKVKQYQRIPSLFEYWAVWVSEILVTHYFRESNKWDVASYGDLEETIRSKRLVVEVPVAEIYRGL